MADNSASDVTGGAATGNAVGEPIGAATGMITVPAPTIAGAPQPSGGGGFTISPEDMDGVINEWRDLLITLRLSHTQASIMTQVEPPGAEFASSDFTERANPSAEALLRAHKKMMGYVSAYLDALQNAKQRIDTQDEQSQEDIGKAGAIEV